MKNLIDGCIKGKHLARKELFSKYRQMLLGICLRYARDKAEAEDILLEGFMQIYTKIGSFSNVGSFEGWMKKVMVNTAIDFFRKNRNDNIHQNIDDFHEVVSPDFDAFNQLSAKDILTMIQIMPQGYRIVFNLFAIEGYSHKEIAEKLQISESTSKSQLRKARIWLVNKLKSSYE